MADRPDLDFPPAEQEQPELFVAGLSHRTAPAELRDRILTEELAGGREELLRRLGAAGIAQALVLATCDRVEVLGAAAAPAAAAEAALAQLAERAGLAFSLAEPHAYRLVGAPALRHLFSVASSLDSMVVGEPQVLGQVKAAHRLAAEAGRIGPDLDACLQAAYAAAKRVRSETELAEQPVSLAAVAAKLARNLHGELSAAQALLIGFGEMGAVIARALQAHGLRDLWVASASPARGGAFAKELGARHRPVAELASALDHADIVIAAAASSGPVLGREAVDAALRRRRRRPMLLIDLGVPGDVAPEVDDLEDAFLYALDDLERIAEGGRARRDRAVAAATAILEEELERWSRERATRAAVPALVALRRHFERARAQVLAHGGGMDAEVATRLLVNRLLHEPTTALKALSAEPAHTAQERRRIERTLLKLFGVERRYGPAGDDDAQS